MTTKAYFTALVLALAFMAFGVSSASAQPPCAKRKCAVQLTATTHAKHWTVPGHVGEAWLLYLNVYADNERLSYLRLNGGCDASYASSDVSVILHACGTQSSMDYVSFAGARALRIEYRYVKR